MHDIPPKIRRHRPMEKQNNNAVQIRKENDDWTPVEDKETGLIYWWNEKTDETTAVGAPKPGTEVKVFSQEQNNDQQQPTVGSGFGQILLYGFGITLAFVFIGRVIGMEAAHAPIEFQSHNIDDIQLLKEELTCSLTEEKNDLR